MGEDLYGASSMFGDAAGAAGPAAMMGGNPYMMGAQIGAQLLGQAMQAPPTSSGANQTGAAAWMDGSGWTVATGGAKAEGGTVANAGASGGLLGQASGAVAALTGGDGGLVLLGVGVLVVVVLLWKR